MDKTVKKIPPRTPVSDELLEAIFNRLKKKNPTPQMQGVRKGEKSAELVFSTSEGEVSCQVKEDDIFIFFEMPSPEKGFCFLKQDFTEAFSGASD